MSYGALLRGDVDAIHRFVFESALLPLVRGGSQLLLECEEAVRQHVRRRGGREIYCGGGNFLFEVPHAIATSLKQEIERIYLEKTLVATVTVAVEDGPPPVVPGKAPDGWAARILKTSQRHVAIDGGFAHRVFLLGGSIREAKNGKGEAPFLESFPFGKRCDTCGKRMAVREIIRRDPEDIRNVEYLSLCPICLRKYQAGIKGQAQTRGKFNEEFRLRTQGQAEQAPDLDHLVSTSRRKYVAFLYADGNDIGSVLDKARSPEELRALSEAIGDGTKEALFATLSEVCGRALEREEYWPFEIVNVGGDDVILLIQAGYAWEVAVAFLARFEQEIRQRIILNLGRWPDDWPEKITAACGIAVAEAKYPLQYMERLANDLLSRAKKLAKARPGVQSALDFLWLPTPVATEHVEPLMGYYQRGTHMLTARPYTLSQARQLMELAAEASQWPRTQRHLWAASLEKGVMASINSIYYNIARRQKEKEREGLVQFLNKVRQSIGAEPHAAPAPLWGLDDDTSRYRTALLDVLELAELRSMRSDIEEKLEG